MKGGDVALLKCLMRSRLSASIVRATESVPREENFNFVLPNIGDVPFHPGSTYFYQPPNSNKHLTAIHCNTYCTSFYLFIRKIGPTIEFH